MLDSAPYAATPSAAQTEMIDRLGGPKAVAEAIADRIRVRLTPQAVSMWRHRGIPWRYRAALADAARERGLTVPTGFMGE